jgi:hypothetical protein
MSANPITEQPITPTQELGPRGGKKSAEVRIAELLRECRGLRAQLETARLENEDLLSRLATIEIAGVDVEEYKRLKAAETARKQELQAAMNHFIAKCEAVSKVQPGFDECLKRIADIPGSWLQEMALMPNGPGFVVFLASNAVLGYLLELKPEAAITRLRQFGFDMHHKLPQFQEVGNGNR